jgi:hypothetical protein
MKFCKDCKHYSPAVAAIGFGIAISVPASCNHGDRRDPVTGDRRIAGLCDSLRAVEFECGSDAAWFEPATLDGRLAMLPSN